MEIYHKIVPTSPFKTLYQVVKDKHEFTVIDNNLDCEFYIYKEENETNEFFTWLVETQEVHVYENGQIVIDFLTIFTPVVNELRKFAREHWKSHIDIDEDDETFIYDFCEDLVNMISQGYEGYCAKVVNILNGKEEAQ